MKNKDQIYSAKLSKIADFAFDDRVADVFPDMIQRSVPGYASIVTMLTTLSERYAQPGSNLYDLGCSLGASALSMRHGIQVEGCKIIAVDCSESMIKRCEKIVERDHHTTPVQLICGDIRDVEIENASMVVLNFTLQFIEPADRKTLLQKIYDGMRPGGILVLSEKVIFEDDHLNELLIDVHHAFKRAQGYSDMEVSQKRSSLENVLIPESVTAHKNRLLNTGFKSCDVWFQCFNFMSMLAIK